MHKLRKGQWVPVIIRITSVGVERVDATSGAPAQPISSCDRCNATVAHAFSTRSTGLHTHTSHGCCAAIARRSLCE